MTPKDLTEVDLLTDDEITGLFKWATVDTERIRGDNGRYRARLPKGRRKGRGCPFWMFEDILRVCYATGPRPGEICALNVR